MKQTMNEELWRAAHDALVWLMLFSQQNAIGKLGRGQSEAVLAENQQRLEDAIAALETALENESRRWATQTTDRSETSGYVAESGERL